MFKIKKQKIKSQLFRLPADTTKIVEFTSQGNYIIETAIGIDTYSATLQGVTGIRVRMYALNPSALTNSSVVPDDVSDTQMGIFIHNNDKIKQSVKAYNSYIDEQMIDVSRAIDPGISLRNSDNKGHVVSKTMGAKRPHKTVTNIRPDRIVLESSDMRRVDLRSGDSVGIISSLVRFNTSTAKPVSSVLREYAFRLLYDRGLDPASVARFPFPIQTAQHAYSGLISNDILDAGVPCSTCTSRSQSGYKALRENNSSKNSTAINIGILNTDLAPGTQDIALMYRRVLSENSPVPDAFCLAKKFKGRYTLLKAHMKIHLDFPIPGDGLSFLFEAMDSYGNVVGNRTLNVDYAQLKLDLEQPLIAPSISASWHTPGINTIVVSQNDPYANEIVVYRKLISSKNIGHSDQMGYSIIAKITASKLDGMIYLTDETPNYGIMIYRAIARSRQQISYGFDSSVVTTPMVSNNLLMRMDRFFAAGYIECQSKSTGVNVEVKEIISNYHSFYILVQDISGYNNPRFAGIPERVLGNRTFLISEANTVLKIFDREVVKGMKYRYRLVFFDHQGIKHESSITYIHTHRYAVKPQAKLQIDSTKMTTVSKNNFRVEFYPRAQFMKSGLEKIVKLLQDGGAADSFIKEIQENKEQFSSILQVVIERYDLVTGDVVSMGMHDPNKSFVDSETFRKANGIPDLIPGRRYRYDVSLYKQSPMTLLPGTTQEVTDPSTLQTYVQNTYKFLSQPVIENGILPASSVTNKISAAEFPEFSTVTDTEQLFQQGDLYIKESTIITTPIFVPQVVNLRVEERNDGKPRLSWHTDGDLIDIDHFIVFCDYAGMKAPVGTAHTFMGLSTTFIDNVLAGAIGPRRYTVLPVFKDFSYGTESLPVFFTKNNNVNDLEMIAS